MSNSELQYWIDCITESLDEHDISLTREEVLAIAEDVKVGHEHYSMAFYEPPASDRISDIEDKHKKEITNLQKEFAAYRNNAETAVKRALRQYPDANVSIGEYGEVTRYDGRTTRIQ